MIEISKLRQFSRPDSSFPFSFVCDLLILEPQEPQETGLKHNDDEDNPSKTDWRYFNVYIINDKPRLELNLGLSENFEIRQQPNKVILGDFKANGLLYFWNSAKEGKLRVISRSTLQIEAFDPNEPDDLLELLNVKLPLSYN